MKQTINYYKKVIEWEELPKKEKLSWIINYFFGVLTGMFFIITVIEIKNSIWLPLFFIALIVFLFIVTLFTNMTRKVRFEKEVHNT